MTKYPDLIRDIKQGKIAPLYLLFGEEAFLIQEAVEAIVKTVVDPGSKEFNFNVVYCRDTSAAELVNLAQTLPFLSEKRLIIAKDIDAYKAADLDELLPYLNDPSPYTCLVLISQEGRYDKKSVISAVESRGVVTRLFPLLERDVIAWIETWAKSHGCSLQRDAAQYLWQIVGNDLQKIRNELEKLELYLKEKKNISFAEVKTAVGDFREYTAFDLASALGTRDREKAFMILSRLIEEGEQPVGLLGGIAWHFRRLLRAKAMEARGMGYEEIKSRLKVIFHQSASFKEQMGRFTMTELRRTFHTMLDADRAIKSSGISGRLVLERMILALCG